MINIEILKGIFPRAKKQDIAMFFHYFLQYYLFAGLTTPVRIAGFLAQIGHETNQFLWLSELASGRAYEGRKDLGNVKIGDGRRFKGRGYIHLTGRKNYEGFQKWILQNQKAIWGNKVLEVPIPNFILNPELVATHRWAILSAIFFWQRNNLNKWADAMDIEKMTRVVNGGLNGFDERKEYWETALQEFGIEIPKTKQEDEKTT
jgi:putative chitinase